MRGFFIAGALALAACAGCSACSSDESSPSADAGLGGAAAASSGGAPSGGGTGGNSSGGKDGGGTGGTSGDAAVDAGEGWELAPWSPPGCQIFRAADLTEAVAPLVWNDCANGLAGCLYFDASPLPSATLKKMWQKFDVALRSTSTFLTVLPIYDKFIDGATIYELGVGPRSAWKSDRNTGCAVQQASFGVDSGAALRVGTAFGNNEVTSGVLYNKTDSWNLDGSPILYVDKTVTGNPMAGVFEVQFSSSIMALQMGLDALIYAWDFGPGKPTLIPRPAEVQQDYGPLVQGSEIVFMRYSANAAARAFAVRHANGTVEKLYQKPSVWADNLGTDGTDFTWQEWNQSTNVVELWTAPWTASPASFAPKKVRTLDGAQAFVRGGYRGEKWWVYTRDDATLRAIRITDGAYLDVPAPTGFGWITPLGVVNGEIWASIFKFPAGNSATYSVARVPIVSLGTPKP